MLASMVRRGSSGSGEAIGRRVELIGYGHIKKKNIGWIPVVILACSVNHLLFVCTQLWSEILYVHLAGHLLNALFLLAL